LSHVDFRRHADEQAVFNDSGDVIQFHRQGLRVFDGAEDAVEDVIAVIGNEIAALGLAAEFLDAPGGGLPTELDHLNR
jgi:hypothetical protein